MSQTTEAYSTNAQTPIINSGKRKREMTHQNAWQQKFGCPIFRTEVANGYPHSCNGKGGNNMSEVRRHLTRPSGGNRAHLQFLKRCNVCNRDIIDESVFNEYHGKLCHDPRPLRKKEAAYDQYQDLCDLLSESVTSPLQLSGEKLLSSMRRSLR